MRYDFTDAFNFYFNEARKMSSEPVRHYKYRANYEQKAEQKAQRKANNRKKNKAARKARKKSR
jgi:hypothetical protein